MVTGPVGSGKTSLLAAMLGELPGRQAQVSLRGSIAYTAQDPWVCHATYGLDLAAIQTCLAIPSAAEALLVGKLVIHLVADAAQVAARCFNRDQACFAQICSWSLVASLISLQVTSSWLRSMRK